MTLKEKVGQMTQLTIQTIVDGKDQDIHINPEKLHKAITEYGVAPSSTSTTRPCRKKSGTKSFAPSKPKRNPRA